MPAPLSTTSLVTLTQVLLTLDDDMHLWGVLDGASIAGLPGMIERHEIPAICLLPGELSPELAAVAPYLVPLDPFPAFLDEVLASSWGRHGGIFVMSDADRLELRQHFRGLTMVYDPNLQPVFFRFYDPRVLRTYLPVCGITERVTVFGPVARYLLEDEDATTLLRYEQEAGQLRTQRVLLAAQKE